MRWCWRRTSNFWAVISGINPLELVGSALNHGIISTSRDILDLTRSELPYLNLVQLH